MGQEKGAQTRFVTCRVRQGSQKDADELKQTQTHSSVWDGTNAWQQQCWPHYSLKFIGENIKIHFSSSEGRATDIIAVSAHVTCWEIKRESRDSISPMDYSVRLFRKPSLFRLQLILMSDFILVGCILLHYLYILYKHKLHGLRVRERTIPTERPPLVGEVIANFCG
jgi:hypothetical protein